MNSLLAVLLTASFAAAPNGSAAPTVSEAPDARAPACADPGREGRFQGPVAVGYDEADIATGRRVCPRSEVTFAGRGGVTVDTPDFYGAIAVDGLLSASRALGARAEVFGTLELLHYRWVQNGPLKGTNLAVGQATVGAAMISHESATLTGATSGRLLLPTSTSGNVRTVGLEVGHAASLRIGDRLELHAHAGVDFSAGLSQAHAYPRVGISGLAGVQYAPWSWLAVVADAQARSGATTYLAPALALRGGFGRVGAELAFTLPLVGSDRHDGLAAVRLGYRFD